VGILRYLNFTTPCPSLGPPFESLVIQLYSHLQASLMDHLHKQKFATFLVDVPLNTIQTSLQTCVDPTIGVWLLVCATTFVFCWSLVLLFTTLCTHLGLPHPIIAHFHVINVDIPLMIYLSICFDAHVRMNTQQPTIIFKISSQLLL
jgi:hypothetical protein